MISFKVFAFFQYSFFNGDAIILFLVDADDECDTSLCSAGGSLAAISIDSSRVFLSLPVGADAILRFLILLILLLPFLLCQDSASKFANAKGQSKINQTTIVNQTTYVP